MVFCIKYRQRLLSAEARCEYLKQVLKEIAERYWFEMEEMGTDGDHVHLFVGAAPKYAPSRVMQIPFDHFDKLSASSSGTAQKHQCSTDVYPIPEIRKQLWGGEFWSDGGYIGTVGDGVNSEIVKRYIQEQGSEAEKARAQQIRLFPL